ncbi:hypothetical protein [Desulfosporosinus sp. BICA1-9]|uniref:hypothetical protein n=1 Tax=Desulfosporosinus sp. BICA1-9 TaxID=1531958 RepID=UPI00054B3587|nr:hypothetical protein [Desulfosporosinus sp. BICA1-9]KJS46195.1 MAG: hypothetical protein VR66_26745 [Peptococcaceae bacterium BRH_c23]KJS89903.1 MAG: hypothetical protein JL57_04760 [Desulfosporosinus sp. BICA1-9]
MHKKGGNVDIKEFIKELKRVTGDYTLEKYYNAFTRIARNISPSQRKFILNILEIVGKQNMDDLDTGLLLEDIKSFNDRVESGKYYDHWGWDEKTHREREFGDESWADEMDAFFRKACHAYEKKEYRIAVKVYEVLFSIFWMADEPGHLPRGCGYEEMLVTDLKEEGLYFLKAALVSEKVDKRHERFHEIISKYRHFLPTPVDIEKLVDEMAFTENEKKSFLLKIIEMYSSIPTDSHHYRLYFQPVLFQALLLTGGVKRLKDFAIKNGRNNPEAFELLIFELKKSGDEKSALEVARTGLSIIPKGSRRREYIAEYIAETGRNTANPSLELEGVREAFYSRMSIGYLVQLHEASVQCGCNGEEMSKALAALEKRYLPEKTGKGFDDDDVDWYLMNQAYVLMGKSRESFALCNNKSVDRYDADKIKALTIPYMIYLLGMKYGGGKADSLKDIKFGWRASFESPWSANDKNDIMNSFIDVTEKNAGTVAGTIKDEEAAGYLKWCKKEVSKRVDDIVGNKCTESYYIAANLLVTMNELLNISNMGELTDGLLAYYYKKYSRYSAFKKEIIAFRDKCENVQE